MKAKRFLRLLILLCASWVFSTSLSAQPYPNKPVRIIVPLAPGGAGAVGQLDTAGVDRQSQSRREDSAGAHRSG